MNTSDEITHSAGELAEILGVNERTVRKLAAAGKIARTGRGRYLAPPPLDPDIAALAIDPNDLALQIDFGDPANWVTGDFELSFDIANTDPIASKRNLWYGSLEFRKFEPFRRKYTSLKR